jgi:8-oxo-dGTP diphosphatase
VPAGHLDGAETVRSAATREAREEVGISIAEDDLEFGHVMHRQGDDERIDFFFVTRAWTGEPRIAEADRCDELRWAEPTRLPANTIPYVAEGIRLTLRGQAFSEFGWSVQELSDGAV